MKMCVMEWLVFTKKNEWNVRKEAYKDAFIEKHLFVLAKNSEPNQMNKVGK
jgi:hypothetical protein